MAVAKVVPGRGRSDRQEAAVLRTADDVARVMGDMKGVAMKIGQIMSLMGGAVPDDFAMRLEGLQSSAPSMAPELVREVFMADFGKSPDKLFRKFEWEPFAAASIGQVHRAQLHDRTEVAVKVQYPGVQEAVGADLSNLGFIFGLVGMAAPGLDPKPMVEDLRRGIAMELDYRSEADRQARFHTLFDGHPFIRVPKIHGELCTGRVLVQEYIKGERFGVLREWPAEDRNRVAEMIYRFTFGSMHRYGLFQADPHAGNYLILDDGTVAFLDYGCVSEFEPGLRLQLNNLIAGVITSDHARWRTGMEDVGYVPRDLDVSTEELWEHMKVYYSFVLEDGVTFTSELASQMVRQNLQLTGQTGQVNRQLNIPEGVVFIQRINFGFAGLMASIRAQGPWQSIIGEYVLGQAPCSYLGERSRAHMGEGWV